ncbi:sigma-70 family RNA polymerase sigma factor [Rossellomorea aquimaris]|uniref:sigma-70 family RNA polymerase sigma factor n=1 Tax=Rossellomorea aquimaris TaxID=189382 RepID=UPI001CD1C1E6|nr:sigma-70 family RNA polymerase sigma factor [Rossellomorea aquimaris]MCA1055238.1 sigma-70 family RNA polymerase sigma factor [Rossellomorea aquimaris]
MKSFHDIQKQFDPMIHKIIHSLHIYNEQEEFYQTGLIALWEASQKFDARKGEFAPFAYSYIKGRILTELSGKAMHLSRQTYPKEEFWELVEDECSDVPLAKETLLAYCEHLTEGQIKWVMYTFMNMFTIKEIAAKEGVSPGAVKKWRQGARERLRGNIKY